MNAFDLLRQPTDPIVTGVVYRATLTNVSDDEPLKGTPYIGQAVRAGAAAVVAAARWKEEVHQARFTKLEIGFIAALDEFGKDAFTWEVLESKTGPRDIVQKWADYREVELIAQHGGTLHNMTPDSWIHQTFNLQKGGKGIIGAISMDAFVAKRWNAFKSKLLEYIEENGSAHVATFYVAPCGYRLGHILGSVRGPGVYLQGRPEEAERRAWLESLPGWVWNGRNAPENRKAISESQRGSSNSGASFWKNSTPERIAERNASSAEKVHKIRDAKREAKRSKLSGRELSRFDNRVAQSLVDSAKRTRDLKALRATIVPDAKEKDLSKYRKDGSVAKALKLVDV